ncbi:putative transposase, partial [Pseudomonas syringae pv. actinidiae ICMP 19094]
PLFFETCCDDSYRCHLARHRADGYARRHRDGVGQSDRCFRCGEAALRLSVCQPPSHSHNGSQMALETEQLHALILGLPWQRTGSGGAITLL